MLHAGLLLLPVGSRAQGYFGTVSGELTDPSGAVILGAKVVFTDQQKGFAFNTTSDNTGRYLFTAIPPGLYSVSAEMQGFEKAVSKSIKVNVTENVTANLRLKMAGATTTVQVEERAQALSTEDAVTGQVVNRKFISDLPLVDRYVLDFVSLAPGVTSTSDTNGVGDTGTNFVSNGSRGASADILMDGASITNFEPNGGVTNVTYTPSAEAVEEFKVQQTNFSAEYGFSGASVVNMITRSGGNSFHGSAYDYIRNKIGDANDWFANQAGSPLPPVHRNNFGGTVGGPIFKNKTFFFFDWDGTRSSDLTRRSAGVPSTNEINGDFGELCTSFAGGSFNGSGQCVDSSNNLLSQGQIYDPYSGVFCSGAATDNAAICPNFNNQNFKNTNSPPPAGAYRGALIPFNNLANYTSPGNPNLNGTPYQLPSTPGNLIDPVAQNLMKLFPAVNFAAGGIYNNWVSSGASHNSSNQFDLKIDHRLSDKNLLSGKFSHGWSHGTPFNCFKNFADPCGSGANSYWSYLFAINDTHTFSPTLILTSTLGWNRGGELIAAYDKSLNANPLQALGFPSYLGTNGFLGVPAIGINDYSNAGAMNIGQDPYGNYKQGQDTGQLAELLTIIRGKHELKLGFEGRIHQQNYIQTNAPVGLFGFNALGNSQCPIFDVTVCGGDSMASFMMGQMTNSGAGLAYATTYEIEIEPATTSYQYAGFAQDNWKVRPNLTLNVGLRYDVNLPRTERFNRQNWFDPKVASPLGSITYTDPLSNQSVTRQLTGGEVFANGNTRTNWLTDWKDFQPRFGFSYLFGSKTVIRGGYGIYFSQTRSGANGLLSYGSQGFNQWTTAVTTYQNDGATPYLHLNNPFPSGLIQPPGSSLGLLNDVGYGAIGPIRNSFYARTPYEQSWSFGFERQLPSSMVFSAHYIGKKGTRLYYNGLNNLNILGPWVEKLSSAQMQTLVSLLPANQNPFASTLTGPYYANSSLTSQIPAYQLEVPFPQFTGVASDEPPVANSIYHALQLTLEKSYSNGLQLSANYTWAKSIDDSSIYDGNLSWLVNNIGFLSGAQDPNKPGLDRSLSSFDIAHVFKLNYTYDLPVGRGRPFLNGLPRQLELIVGGWKTAGVWTVHDGFPLAFIMAGGGTPIPTYGQQRPNLTGTPRRAGGGDGNWTLDYFADPTVFADPGPYTLGNMARTSAAVRSPFFVSANMSLAKEFTLSTSHEAMKLELRMDAQNAFNHPVFGTPNTFVSGAVGQPGDFGSITYTAVGPRQLQLSLKFSF